MGAFQSGDGTGAGPVPSATDLAAIAQAIRNSGAEAKSLREQVAVLTDRVNVMGDALARIETLLRDRPAGSTPPLVTAPVAPTDDYQFSGEVRDALVTAWCDQFTKLRRDPAAPDLKSLPASKLQEILAACAINTGKHPKTSPVGMAVQSLMVALHQHERLQPWRDWAARKGYESLGLFQPGLVWLVELVTPGCTRFDALRLRLNADVAVPNE